MVKVEKQAAVWTVILDRPKVRNAVDRDTAAALAQAFRDFDSNEEARVAVLYGEGGHFCAGADLKAVAEANREELFSLGLWGVPSFRVNSNNAHWGQDRLWVIEQELQELSK